MPEDVNQPVRDPASGYVSADALDPRAPVNRDQSAGAFPEEKRDAMSGYTSADVMGSEKRKPETHQAPIQDPVSGYASADALEVPKEEK